MIKISKDIIDVDFTETNDSTSGRYHDLEYAVKLLGVDQEQIIFWCNKFKDVLKIEFIGQYLIFDNDDLNNLKKIKKLNIDENMDVKTTKKYLNTNPNIIVHRKQAITETSLMSILTKIVNQQNKKINTITSSHNKIVKSNKQIIENQQKFIDMFTQLCEDQLENKEILNKIQEHQLKKEEIENLDTKLNTNIDSIKSEIALDSENKAKQAKEIIEKIDKFNELTKNIDENQSKAMKKLITLSDTTSRIEKHKEETSSKKKTNIWNKIFKRKDNDE